MEISNELIEFQVISYLLLLFHYHDLINPLVSQVLRGMIHEKKSNANNNDLPIVANLASRKCHHDNSIGN